MAERTRSTPGPRASESEQVYRWVSLVVMLPDGQVALTVGQCLLEFIVRYHTAPVFINPTKSRLVQLGIKVQEKQTMASTHIQPLRPCSVNSGSFLPRDLSLPCCWGMRNLGLPSLVLSTPPAKV